MKNFLIVLFNILFIASVVCSVTFGIEWKKTRDELNSDSQFLVINELREENTRLNHELDELSISNKFLEMENESLSNENSALTEQNSSLQESNSALTEQNENLSNNNESLTSQIESLLSQKNELEGQVSSLDSQIDELEALLDRYESLLPFVIEEDEAVVKYVVEGETKDIQVVQIGSKITDPYEVTFAEGEYHLFNYYEVNGSPVDFSTYVVEDDVTLVANITYRCKVSYYEIGSAPSYKGELITEDYIEIGGTIDLSVLEDGYNYAFARVTEGRSPIGISLDTPITNDTEFVVKKWTGNNEPPWGFDSTRE